MVAVLHVFSALIFWVCGTAAKFKEKSIFDSLAGSLLAFADVTGDKYTDVLTAFYNADGSVSLRCLLSTDGSSYSYRTLLNFNSSVTLLLGVVPSDYDGDQLLDLLVTAKRLGTEGIEAHVYWGKEENVVSYARDRETVVGEFASQPMILDHNGDMLPDLLTEESPGKRFYFLSSKNRTFTRVPFPGIDKTTHSPFSSPHSNAFIDLNHDFSPDLFLTVNDSKHPFEIWFSTDKPKPNVSVSLPDEYKDSALIGQSAFVDIDADGSIEHVVPLCIDAKCQKNVIICSTPQQDPNRWFTLLQPSAFLVSGDRLGFHGSADYPITLRFGDTDNDGYPDALVVLQNNSDKKERRMYILANVPCTTNCTSIGGSGKLKRTLELQPAHELTLSHSDVVQAAFYDYQVNGALDVIAMTGAVGTAKPKNHHLRLFQNRRQENMCFLTVKVLSGVCDGNCPHNRATKSVNLPGPVVCFDTTSPDGVQLLTCGGQMAQSAHRPLQLPLVHFGLGVAPNFIAWIKVGIPTPPGKEPRYRTWKQIVPNSQHQIIPYPPQSPDKWTDQLYMTPTDMVITTAICLAGTCALIAIITGLLHWAEKRQDHQEKLQESHKFHFDAM